MEHEDRTDDIAKAGMSSLFKKKRDPTEMGASTTVPWQDGNTMSSTGGPDQYAPRTPYAGKVRDTLERPAPKGPSFIDAMKQGLDLGGTSVPEKVEAPEKVEVPKEPKADALGPKVDANETEVEPIPSGGGKVDTPVDDAVEIPEKVEIQDVPETDAEGMSTNLTDEDRAAWNERYRAEQEGEQEKIPEESEADEAPLTDDDAFRERYGEERYVAAKNWAKLLGKGAMAVGQGVLDSDWGDDAVHAFDSTRRIVSAFLTGNPLSAASAIVGESVSNLNRMADSSEEIGRRMGIMAGANEKLLNDTIVGKLHGRKVEQDRRITNDVLMKVDDALSSLGADDITQLTSEQLDGFFDRMAAGHDEATRALKEYYAGERDLTPMEREAAYKQMKVYGQVISDIAQHSDEKKKEYARQSARLRQLNANRNRLEKQRSLALIERKRRDTTGLGRVAMEVLGDRVDLDDKGRPPERTWTRFANNLESRLNSSDLTPEQRQSYTNALSWVRHASKTPEDISRERMLAGTTDEGRFIHGLTQRGIPVNPDGSYNRSHAGTVALNAEEWISKHPDATPEQVALARKVADEAKELAKPDSRKRREQRDAEFRARYDASSPEAREIYDMMGDKAQEIVVDDQGYPNPDKARMVRNKALAQSENPALTDDQRARYEEIANKMQAYLDGPVKVARQEAEARWQSEATDWSRFMRDEIIGAKSTIAVDPRTGEVALKDKKIAAERIDGYLRKNPGLDPQMRSALEATRDKWMREREGYLDSRRSTTRRKAIFENRDLSIAERLMGGHENTPRSDTGVNGITGYSLSAQILSKDMERASQWQDENIRLDYPEVYAAMGQGMSMEDMENSQDPELKAEFDRMIHDPKFIANQHAVDNLRRMTEYKTVERRIRDVATMRGVPREEVDRDLAELRYQCYDTINRRAEDGSASEYIPPSEDGPYMDLMMDILENYGLAKPVSDGEGEQSAEGTGQPKQRRSTTRRDGGGITRNYVYTVNNVNLSPIMQYADNRNYVVDNSISMGLAQDNSTYTQNNLNVNMNMDQGTTTGGKRSGTRRSSRRTDNPDPSITQMGVEEDVEPPKYQQPEAKRSISADHGIHNRLVEINKQFGNGAKGTPESRLALYNEIQEMFGGDVPTVEELDEEYLALEDDWRRQMGMKTIPPDVKKQLKQAVYGTPNPTSIRGRLRAYHSYDPSEDELAIETRRQEEENAQRSRIEEENRARGDARRQEREQTRLDQDRLAEEGFTSPYVQWDEVRPIDYNKMADAEVDKILAEIQAGNLDGKEAVAELREKVGYMMNDPKKKLAYDNVLFNRGQELKEAEKIRKEEEVPVEENIEEQESSADKYRQEAVDFIEDLEQKVAMGEISEEEGNRVLNEKMMTLDPDIKAVYESVLNSDEEEVSDEVEEKKEKKKVRKVESSGKKAGWNPSEKRGSGKFKERLSKKNEPEVQAEGPVPVEDSQSEKPSETIQEEPLKENTIPDDIADRVKAEGLENVFKNPHPDEKDFEPLKKYMISDLPGTLSRLKKISAEGFDGKKDRAFIEEIAQKTQHADFLNKVYDGVTQNNPDLDAAKVSEYIYGLTNPYTYRSIADLVDEIKGKSDKETDEKIQPAVSTPYHETSGTNEGSRKFRTDASGDYKPRVAEADMVSRFGFKKYTPSTDVPMDAQSRNNIRNIMIEYSLGHELDDQAMTSLSSANYAYTKRLKKYSERLNKVKKDYNPDSEEYRVAERHLRNTLLGGAEPGELKTLNKTLTDITTGKFKEEHEKKMKKFQESSLIGKQESADEKAKEDAKEARKELRQKRKSTTRRSKGKSSEEQSDEQVIEEPINKAESFRDMMSSAMEDFAKTHNKTMEDHIMRDGFRPTEHS